MVGSIYMMQLILIVGLIWDMQRQGECRGVLSIQGECRGDNFIGMIGLMGGLCRVMGGVKSG